MRGSLWGTVNVTTQRQGAQNDRDAARVTQANEETHLVLLCHTVLGGQVLAEVKRHRVPELRRRRVPLAGHGVFALKRCQVPLAFANGDLAVECLLRRNASGG